MKNRVINAYFRLLPTKGLYHVTMDELSKEAGISKRTLYRYFETKDALIDELFNHFFDRMNHEIDETIRKNNCAEDIFDGMSEIVCGSGQTMINPVVLEDLRQYYPHYWEKLDRFRINNIEKVIHSVIEENPECAKDIDPRLVSKIIISSMQAILNPYYVASNNLPIKETARQMLAFFKRGLGINSDN